MSERDFVAPHRVECGSLLGAGGYGVVYEGVLDVDGTREQVTLFEVRMCGMQM